MINNRSSNPFEPLKVKQLSEVEVNSKDAHHTPSPNRRSPMFGIQSEDIKVEIDVGDSRKSAVPTMERTLTVPNTHLVPSSKPNSVLGLIRSPIKEEKEEDETSHQETPSQSLMDRNRQYDNPMNTFAENTSGQADGGQNTLQSKVNILSTLAQNNLYNYEQENPRNDNELAVPKFEIQETENDSIFERGYDSYQPEDFNAYKYGES